MQATANTNHNVLPFCKYLLSCLSNFSVTMQQLTYLLNKYSGCLQVDTYEHLLNAYFLRTLVFFVALPIGKLACVIYLMKFLCAVIFEPAN